MVGGPVSVEEAVVVELVHARVYQGRGEDRLAQRRQRVHHDRSEVGEDFDVAGRSSQEEGSYLAEDALGVFLRHAEMDASFDVCVVFHHLADGERPPLHHTHPRADELLELGQCWVPWPTDQLGAAEADEVWQILSVLRFLRIAPLSNAERRRDLLAHGPNSIEEGAAIDEELAQQWRYPEQFVAAPCVRTLAPPSDVVNGLDEEPFGQHRLGAYLRWHVAPSAGDKDRGPAPDAGSRNQVYARR